MSEAYQLLLRKVLAFATGIMMVTTLAAISVVKADHAKGKQVVSGNTRGAGGGASDITDEGLAGTEGQAGTDAGTATGGGTGAAAGAGATAGGAARTGAAAAGGGCTDYNPDIGVFCDHFLVGGTTVLSGPLAVYGDQGLKGGLAWINYYNTVIAPREHLRQSKLIWYDDNLDPNKTLSYVKRLHDVDKVLYLGGVTSPEAIADYLETNTFPMIGDIGLAPKSWTNRMIFPTAPSQDVRDPLRIHIAKDRFGIKNFAVIQDHGPGVDTTPDKNAWKAAATKYSLDELDYVEMLWSDSDCSAQFNRVIQKTPDFIILPTATPPMLACLRSAAAAGGIKPGGAASPWLKGWSGGSNLQLEVDNCKPACEGMYSIGTIFNDPRVSNTEQMRVYRDNMAKYAPNVDITGSSPSTTTTQGGCSITSSRRPGSRTA